MLCIVLAGSPSSGLRIELRGVSRRTIVPSQ
uniref:Uncharacterized protein n=1 Tax=Vitis vinifera TaxID=29760 RepID=F6GTL9_VITVI